MNQTHESKSRKDLLEENLELKSRLDEAEDTLKAIQNGEIDAIVTPEGEHGSKVYTLESADYLYRILVQEMNQGVITLTDDGTIFYSNSKLALMLELPLEKITGLKFDKFVDSADQKNYRTIFRNGLKTTGSGEINIKSVNGTIIPIHISINCIEGLKGVYAVISDLSERKYYEKLETAHKNLNESLEALKNSEIRYSTLFDSMTEGFSIVELLFDEDKKPVDCRYLTVNDAFKNHTGLKKDEIIGKTNNELFPNAKNVWLKKYGEVACSGEPAHFQEKFGPFNRLVDVHAFQTEPGKIGVIFSDITEKKKAENELKKHAALLNLSNEAIFSWEYNGAILSWNHGAERLYGYNKKEAIGSVSHELLQTVFPIKYSEFMKRLATTKNWAGELTHIKKDGTKIIVESRQQLITDISGKKIIIETNRDITDRKRVENQLQTTLKRFYTVLSSMYGAILLVSNDNRVEFINQAFCDVFELEDLPYELIGLTDRDILDMIKHVYVNPDEAVKHIEEIVKAAKPVKGEEILLSRDRTFMRDFIPIYIDQKSYGRLWHHMDISKLKKTEEDLKISGEKLSKSNAELEHFAYVASHDLREPLRMITSFLQLLERRYKNQLDEDADEFIGFAVDGAKRLDEMINDLLKYSHVSNTERKFRPVDMEHVLEHSLINLIIPTEETQATITNDPLPTVLGDEKLLIQLFQNLIANAIKYRSEKPPEIHISAQKEDDDQYIFSVKDNGIGIDPKHLGRIFTIFQRLHRRDEFEGTGIGLAIVEKIVHIHSGQIWAESKLGEGSTFYFTIPIKK
jgi:PAS domain S-box-containing protein